MTKSKDYLMAYHANCIRLYEEAETGRQLTLQGYDFRKRLARLKKLLKKIKDPSLSHEEWIQFYNTFLDTYETSLKNIEATDKAIKENDQHFINQRNEHLKQLKALVNEEKGA